MAVDSRTDEVTDSIHVQTRRVGRVEVDPSSLLVIDGQRLTNHNFDGVELEKFTAINSRFKNCSFVDAEHKDRHIRFRRISRDKPLYDFSGWIRGGATIQPVNVSGSQR